MSRIATLPWANVYATWLYIIGTKANAERLLAQLPRAPDTRYDVRSVGRTLQDLRSRVVEPALCPTQILYGQSESRRLYADARYRPALDAWDTAVITRRDILALCTYIARGKYHGPAYVVRGSQRVRKAA